MKLMKHLVFATTIIALLLISPIAAQKDESRLVQFQMAILMVGPKWQETKASDRNAILKAHLANVVSLLDSGKAVVAGPFADGGPQAGIFILRAASSEEATAVANNDPAVKA